jgi:hypothetical protein
MTSRIWSAVLTLVAVLASSTALAATTHQTTTIKRVYVSNAALSIVVASPPAGCPYGILASDQDPAYDRWISIAMLAFQNQYSTVVEYDPATCKLASLAISTI